MASEQAFHFDDEETLIIGSRQVTIAMIPHFTALLSICGSLFIIIDVVRDKQKIHKMSFHRLMLGMSVSDMLASIFLFLSTWPIPKGAEGVYGAVGNLQTCVAQGFFIQLGVATFVYTAFLSMYYLLMMRYNWKERDLRGIEWIWHTFAISLTLGTAISSIVLDLYNNANLWCWIAPYPLDCLNSSKNDGLTTCERGDDAYIFRIAFYFIWLWLAVLITAYSMTMIFWTVYKQRQVTRKWDVSTKFGQDASRRENTLVREVAIQSALYIVAFLITAIFPSLVRMFQAKLNCTSTFYPLTILTTTFFPLQGFWNCVIYLRPRYVNARRKHPTWNVRQALRYTVGRTFGWTLPSDDQDYQLGTVQAVGPTQSDSTGTASTSQGGGTLGDLFHEGQLDVVEEETSSQAESSQTSQTSCLRSNLNAATAYIAATSSNKTSQHAWLKDIFQEEMEDTEEEDAMISELAASRLASPNADEPRRSISRLRSSQLTRN